LTPSVINQPDFAGAELMAGNLCSKTFAGKFVCTRYRHKILHSRMSADLPEPNVLLYGFRQLTYERQAA